MKILITGNMGYIGPDVVHHFHKSLSDIELIGFDIGYFAHCLSNNHTLPESRLTAQYFGDIRNFPQHLLDDVDVIINLAAISNDPMGNKYEQVTMDVNYYSAVKLAKLAKKAGVKSFVYASSCSIYGAADDSPKIETDNLNPLTAYAKSKIAAERDLEKIADDSFCITCLRFATACGYTGRLRLDLVLNDFVAGAIVNKEISILSDGTPWRPLINTNDMARAIEWAIVRKNNEGGNFLAINAGSNEWNVQVIEVAEEVAKILPGVKISVNKNALPDKRSYKVNFNLYEKLAPHHQPLFDLRDTIQELKKGMENISLQGYRDSIYIRLKVLDNLSRMGLLNGNLEWT